VGEAAAQKATSLIMKDVAWLWRSAYNLAVQGCAEWEEASYDQIAGLFDVASDVSGTFGQNRESYSEIFALATWSLLPGIAGGPRRRCLCPSHYRILLRHLRQRYHLFIVHTFGQMAPLTRTIVVFAVRQTTSETDTVNVRCSAFIVKSGVYN
jgi:hypothetical protein